MAVIFFSHDSIDHIDPTAQPSWLCLPLTNQGWWSAGPHWYGWTRLNIEMRLLLILNAEWPSLPAPCPFWLPSVEGCSSPRPPWWNKHPGLSFLSSPMGFPIGCTQCKARGQGVCGWGPYKEQGGKAWSDSEKQTEDVQPHGREAALIKETGALLGKGGECQ